MSAPLMNTNELAAALGYSAEYITRLKKQNPRFVQQFEARMPLGTERMQRRYSPEKVAAFKAGESVCQIGSARRLRRVC